MGNRGDCARLLAELAGEELSERAAMSLINANVAAPVNLAAALNVASGDVVGAKTDFELPSSQLPGG